jgi:hypothetical protein
MNIEPNILFVSHQGAPFVGDEVHTHNPPRGAPFYNAFATVITETQAKLTLRWRGVTGPRTSKARDINVRPKFEDSAV